MSSEWIIVAAAAVVIAIGSSQMIGGMATERAERTTESFAGIPTFGAPSVEPPKVVLVRGE